MHRVRSVKHKNVLIDRLTTINFSVVNETCDMRCDIIVPLAIRHQQFAHYNIELSNSSHARKHVVSSFDPLHGQKAVVDEED